MISKNSQISKIKEYLTSTIHALLADNSLQIEFDQNQKSNFFLLNQNIISEEKKVILPQIQLEESQKEEDSPRDSGFGIISFRSLSDLASCYLLFHDQEIHQKKNRSDEEQIFFDGFEKIRVIAEVKNSYLGIVKNILEKIETDIDKSEISQIQAMPLILLNEVFAEKIGQKIAKKILQLEKNLSKKLLQEIKNLTKNISDQEAFMQDVARVLEIIKKEQSASEENEKAENPNDQSQKLAEELLNFNQENIDAKNEENSPSAIEEEKPQSEKQQEETADLKENNDQGNFPIRLEKLGFTEEKIEYKNPYKIFSSKFDEVIFPQKLISKNELENLRDQLDLRLAKLSVISKKMTLKLKRKLLSKKNLPLEFDSNRGILNRKKLSRLVIDPFLEDIYINQKTHEYQDTALTILLDNSGSMRGNPIVMSALACEIIASILEKFSVKTEIIGFTTADWKGGRVRKLWENVGTPKNPGRLNELRHIIYKQFSQNFKKAKINLGLMLKEGALKENIDGEALLFARSRLMQQDQYRKILLVISDGTPVDDSTVSANDSNILSDHLRHVINKIEKQSKIEIVGIGIGHTTEEFYKNSITIRNSDELGDAMIEKISQLL